MRVIFCIPIITPITSLLNICTKGFTMASFTKRNGKWQARISWHDENGKLHQKAKSGFATKAQAKDYAIQMESELINGVDIAADPIFADYFKTWCETYRLPKISKATARNYMSYYRVITSYFGETRIKQIKRSTYQQFLNDYGKDHSLGTMKEMTSKIKACVKSAIADGIITKDFTYNANITYDKSLTRNPEYLSINELKRLISALNDDLKPDNVKPYIVLTAIYTGARFSEIIALTWKDVDYLHRTITINKSIDYKYNTGFKPTKNESSNRTIRVNNELLKTLSQLKVNQTPLLFAKTPQSFRTIFIKKVNAYLKSTMERIGIKKRDYTFHALRHSHVAFLLSQGIDIYAISKRLGHSNMTTTSDVYAYLIDEYKHKLDDEIEQKLAQL